MVIIITKTISQARIVLYETLLFISRIKNISLENIPIYLSFQSQKDTQKSNGVDTTEYHKNTGIPEYLRLFHHYTPAIVGRRFWRQKRQTRFYMTFPL